MSLRGALVAFALLAPGCAGVEYHEPFPGSPSISIPWRPWEPAAFAKAAAEDKLILINVRAGWCHGCHVMDEETFAYPDVARLVSERFVAIRVDADARPDVGERYAGWGCPVTVILTPSAEPILERRGVMRHRQFLDLLREGGRRQGAGADFPREPAPAEPFAGSLTAVRKGAQRRLDALYDETREGWGQGKQKVPASAPVEHSFLRAWLRPDEGVWRERALATLTQELNLIDPEWGGVYRYSDDGTWTSPHYEKLLSVQAGALRNFAQARRLTQDVGWLLAAEDVLRFVLVTLRNGEGTFAASQDAEPPARTKMPGGPSSAAYFGMSDADRRRWGNQPRVDPAVYANLNGQLIAALCVLFRATGDVDHLALAATAAERLLVTHRREVPLAVPLEGLPVADSHWAFGHVAGGTRVHLADQAQMGAALLAVYGVTGEKRWLDGARATARGLLVELEDVGGGGFWTRAKDPQDVGVFATPRKPFVLNAVAARFLIGLAAATGEAGWRAAAERALRAIADEERISRQGPSLGEYLLALDELSSPAMTLGVAATKPGLVIAAPHEGFDEHTAPIATAVAADLGAGWVVATGYREPKERRWFDVNRPSQRLFKGRKLQKAEVTPDGEAIYSAYQKLLFTAGAKRGQPLDLLVEIHGHARVLKGTKKTVRVIELATRGFSQDELEALKARYGERVAELSAKDRVPLAVEQLDTEYEFAGQAVKFHFRASGAKKRGSLRPEVATRVLHFELPPDLRFNAERRAAYAKILAQVLGGLS